jgi:hypothetical protein
VPYRPVLGWVGPNGWYGRPVVFFDNRSGREKKRIEELLADQILRQPSPFSNRRRTQSLIYVESLCERTGEKKLPSKYIRLEFPAFACAVLLNPL